MQLKNFLAGIIGFLSCLSIAIPADAQYGTFKYNTRINGNMNGYYEVLPPDYTANTDTKYPLIIYIHGYGATGDGMPAPGPTQDDAKGHLEFLIYTGWGTIPWRAYRETLPTSFTVDGKQMEYIMINPQFMVEPYFNYPDRTANVDITDLLEYCFAHYRIDPQKVYLTGQSAGANYIMNYMASGLPNSKKIAAVVATSPGANHSTPNTGSTPAKGQAIANTHAAVWISVSEIDFIDPVDDQGQEYHDAQDWINDINNANPTIGATLYVLPGKNNHNAAATTTYDPSTNFDGKNIYQWMFQFSNLDVVPLTGIKLSANPENKFIRLNWNSFLIHLNSTFNIERSSNGEQFNSIGIIQSINSSSETQYTFLDQFPLNGNNFYRIFQRDANGKITYSTVVSVKIDRPNAIRIFPNPARKNINIYFEKPITNTALRIYSSGGALVKELKIRNTNSITIDVSNLSKGVYNGILSKDGNITHFNFVRE